MLRAGVALAPVQDGFLGRGGTAQLRIPRVDEAVRKDVCVVVLVVVAT